MGKIRFRWHVLFGEKVYAPGELIEVPDPENYIKEGAEIIEDSKVPDEAVEVQPRRGRRKKED